jgi:hypothetical protein
LDLKTRASVPEERRKLKFDFGVDVLLPTPTPPGNADGFGNKELAKKAIRNNMKIKGGQKPRHTTTQRRGVR